MEYSCYIILSLFYHYFFNQYHKGLSSILYVKQNLRVYNQFNISEQKIMLSTPQLLIRHQSMTQDYELDQLFPGIFPWLFLYDCQSHQEQIVKQPEEIMQEEISCLQEDSSNSTEMISKQLFSPAIPSKTKKISKSYVEQSIEKYSRATNRRTKYKKNSGDKPKGYPTKNFLPCFKMPHIDYLRKRLGRNYVDSFELIQKLRQKNGISMQDYQSLYSIKEFERCFEQFFENKVLYKQLMTSRATLQVKKIHQKKLNVFQIAFKSKQFTRIN